MFVKVHPPNKMKGGSNKGSSSKIINYLEKENNGKDEKESELFFNHSSDKISAEEAQMMIDKNNKNIGKDESKFFMLSINPSDSEQRHLIEKVTGKTVNNINELTFDERNLVFLEVKKYANEVMGEYARNFGRENVTSEKDLVYVAKIETKRSYVHYSDEVKHNKNVRRSQQELRETLKGASPEEAKKTKEIIANLDNKLLRNSEGKVITTGMVKEGFNLHVHVVVSRNNVLQNTKLSPLSKSRGGEQMLNGKKVMQGFNHEQWKQRSADRFNSMYNYKPNVNDRYVPKSKRQDRSLIMDTIKGKLDITRNIKGKIKGLATEMATSNMMSTERMAITETVQTAKNIAMIVTNPKSAVISIAKQLASKILTNAKYKT
ncbi:MobB family relaxase [Sphingobacterium kitahiroshimense]|uniref:MobB family relaxase n=1 Tax=Sphingobacterium kitahiroshimense TaxID=470446 RepID=UPI0032097FAF